MPVRLLAPLAILSGYLAGCEDAGDAPAADRVALVVDTPAYGAFLGEGPAVVTGRVWPPGTAVAVEGVPAWPDTRGAFRAEVPLGGPWCVLDVVAARGDARARARIPVFRGSDPASTWPGGIPVRVLPAGLAVLGGAVGPLLDASGWAEPLSAALPSVDLGWLALDPAGLTHAATESTLAPAPTGVALALRLRDLTITYDAVLSVFGIPVTVPISLAYGTVAVDALVIPSLDAAGRVALAIAEPTVHLADPDVTVGPLDGTVLEWVLEAIDASVSEPLADLLLGVLVDALGTLDLGGPFGLRTDLLGTPLELDLRSLYGDREGLALGFAAGIGGSSPEAAPDVPFPRRSDAPGAQAVVGLHEHVLETVLSDRVVPMLDLDLGGLFGDLAGTWVEALPGGEDAPEGDGWCVALHPGPASVVRLQEGLDPIAVLYVPDLVLDVGVAHGSACDDWLEASLAVEFGLVVQDGTRLSLDARVAEGAVLAYGTSVAWDEAEVVDGLTGLVETVLGLAGSMVTIDLGDLVALDPSPWGLPPLVPGVMACGPLCGEDGACPEGLHAVGLDLFADTWSVP